MSSYIPLILSPAVILAAYLLGSVSFAVVVSRMMKLQDPRTFGSGNPGATNVLRTGNKKAAALTLLGDAAKGWLAVWLAIMAAKHYQLSELTVPLSAIAVFLGHLYPVFLQFKGGKGVATALGILIAIQPWLALAAAATWAVVVYATRYSSLAAIMTAVFTPIIYSLGDDAAWDADPIVGVAIIIICALLIYRHKANISRLLMGKESPIGGKKKK